MRFAYWPSVIGGLFALTVATLAAAQETSHPFLDKDRLTALTPGFQQACAAEISGARVRAGRNGMPQDVSRLDTRDSAWIVEERNELKYVESVVGQNDAWWGPIHRWSVCRGRYLLAHWEDTPSATPAPRPTASPAPRTSPVSPQTPEVVRSGLGNLFPSLTGDTSRVCGPGGPDAELTVFNRELANVKTAHPMPGEAAGSRATLQWSYAYALEGLTRLDAHRACLGGHYEVNRATLENMRASSMHGCNQLSSAGVSCPTTYPQ